MDMRADVEEGGRRPGTPPRGRLPKGSDTESAHAGASIDERLETIARTIRSWDWRSGIVDGGETERPDEPPSEEARSAPAAPPAPPLRLRPLGADQRRERPPTPPAEQARVVPLPVDRAPDALPRIDPRRVARPRIERERFVPPPVQQPRVAPPRVEREHFVRPPIPPRASPPPVEQSGVASPRVERDRSIPPRVEPALVSPITPRDAPLSPPTWRWAHSTASDSVIEAPRRPDLSPGARRELQTATLPRTGAADASTSRSGAVRRIEEPVTHDAAVTATADAVLDDELGSETDELDARRRWGRVILWAVAAVVVVIAVALIRMNAPGSTPNGLTPTTVHSESNAPPKARIAVSPTVTKAFVTASTPLKAANYTVTQAMASSSGQTTAQTAAEVIPYAKALDTFSFDLHFISWPPSMQVASENLTVRVKDLSTFIASISSATPAGLATWESQFKALAAQTETSDNMIRTDIGLRTTTGYP
jgi:hypothetical protein